MALRKIETDGYDPVPNRAFGRPELIWVSVSDLVIDDRYQRPIIARGRTNIRKIAQNFDWAKFSPVVLSRRPDGLLAIIDGQHRTHAAAICGIESVPAIINEMSIEQEAAAFSWINNTVTPIGPHQVFKAALTAFEPWAVQCDAVVRDAGCKLMTFNGSSGNKGAAEVYCIGLVRKAIEEGHQAALSAVLKGIMNSQYRDEAFVFTAGWLSPLLRAAVATSTINPDVVASFLNETSLDLIDLGVRGELNKPQYQGRTFRSLLHDAVRVLLQNHLQTAAARSGEAA